MLLASPLTLITAILPAGSDSPKPQQGSGDGQASLPCDTILAAGGRPTWEPALTATVGSQPSVLSVADGTSVQVQLLGGDGYSWPTEVVEMEQRYSEAPPARLRVLTPDAFAAAKLGAWIDRGPPRDLYDLWAMSERGLIGPSALRVFIAHGPFGTPPATWVFDRVLDEGAWTSALGHQTPLRVSAREATTVVREAWLGTATYAPAPLSLLSASLGPWSIEAVSFSALRGIVPSNRSHQ